MNIKKLFRDKRIKVFFLIIIVLFFIPYPKLRYGNFFEVVSDSMHFPLFILISLGVFYFFKEIKTSKLIFSLFVVPALIEIIQPIFGRGASFEDLFNGYVGVLLVIFYYFDDKIFTLGIKGLIQRIFAYLLIFIGFVILIIFPLKNEYLKLENQKREFPILFKPGVTSKGFWEKSNSLLDKKTFYLDGAFQTKEDKYSGLEYNANGFDWTNFNYLIIKIESDQEQIFELNLRIDDSEKCEDFSDRYNSKLTIKKGINTFNIPFSEIINGPANRKLDLSMLKRLMIFTNPESTTRNLKLLELRLE